ncbi:MAG: hypothetical protein BroJett030_32090 [Alphaproteobacteria bacterium]|nr:MAG: hypothetical protein BroJett030_32090 [Alphaproteobacteria bacterium]
MDGAPLPTSTEIRPAACPARASCAGPAADRRPPARPAEIATRFVVRLVACATQADEAAILGLSRGTANVARARHIAMYLLHTSLSIPYGDVGARFSRDRTTVSHACRIVEDLRDDPALDAFIARLEEMVELAGSMASARWRLPGGPGRGGDA